MITRQQASIVLAAMCLMAPTATGQDKPASESSSISGRVARKISEILGGVDINDESAVELDDLALAVGISLLDVDPDKISELNKDMSRLQELEDNISSQIQTLGSGLPLELGDYDRPFSPMEDLSKETLELEKDQLLARQVEIKELELIQQRRKAKANAIHDAKSVTPLSRALLSTLEDIPVLTNRTTILTDKTNEFPGRMARALFMTKDYVGALKHFKLVPDEELTPRDRYEMARCQEEADEIEKALVTVEKLINTSMATDDFWHERAVNLKKLFQAMLGMSLEEIEGKESQK